MTESITGTAYEEIKKRYKRFFDVNYLKLRSFSYVQKRIFTDFGPQYVVSVLMFQLAAEVALFIKYSREIFDKYSRQDRNDLKNFLKNMRQVTSHINKINIALDNISGLIEKGM